MEGEGVQTASDVSVFRGQAEGERLEGMEGMPLKPRLNDTPSDSGSNNEDSSSKHFICKVH